MKKVAILSYYKIPGIKTGFQNIGNYDIYTRNYETDKCWEKSSHLLIKKSLLTKLYENVLLNIKDYSSIYLVIDTEPEDKSLWPLAKIIEDFHYRKKIQLTLVGCTCCSASTAKHWLTYTNNKIRWMPTDNCNPSKKLLEIISN